MKRKLLLGLLFVVLAVLSGYIVYQTSPTGSTNISKIYCGYLVCQLCAGASQGMSADGVNVQKHPEQHSVSCLKMPACAGSGFGIFIKMQDGQYSFYKFDKRGSDIALRDIVTKTAKTDNMSVEVTGKLRNRTIMVERVVEK